MTDDIIEQRIHIRATFKEAWNNVKGFGNKGRLWLAIFTVLLASVLLQVIFKHGFEGNFAVSCVERALLAFIIGPMSVGLLMLAVRWVMKQPMPWKSLFDFYPSIIRIFLINLLTVLPAMGLLYQMNLWMVPGLKGPVFDMMKLSMHQRSLFIAEILVIALLGFVQRYALLILVDHRVGVLRAIFTSARGLLRHAWRLVLLLLSAIILMALVLIPVGVLLAFAKDISALPGVALFVAIFIWFVPWWMNVVAIIYRTIFGVQSFQQG